MVIRTDAHGHYRSMKSRLEGGQKVFCDRTPLTVAKLAEHFRGQDVGHVRGLYPAGWVEPSEAGAAAGEVRTCLAGFCAVDVDRHSEDVDPDANWRAVLAWAEKARSLGFATLLVDSNGAGGFHLFIFFSSPVAAESACRFAAWLCSDWATRGLKTKPESFPKSESVAFVDKNGNPGVGSMIRLPGRHHTRPVFSRVWDGERWLEGSAAIDLILATVGTAATDAIPTEALASPPSAPKAKKAGSGTRKDGAARMDPEVELRLVREALRRYPNRGLDYDSWLNVGLSLSPLGQTGRTLWLEWSAESSKHVDGYGEDKWESFDPAGARGLGSLFRDAGNGSVDWVTPWLKENAPLEKPPKDGAAERNGHGDDDGHLAKYSDGELGIIRATSVKPARVEWDWRGRVARGKFTLLAGEGDDGKSQFAAAYLARITTGVAFPDGSLPGRVGHCLVLAAEDGPADTTVPRLIAAGANLALIDLIEPAVRMKEVDGRTVISPMSFQDLGYWAELIRRRPGLTTLVADPIPAYLGRNVDDHRNADLRAVLTPFLALLESHGVTLLGITHIGKSVDGRTPLNKVLGSVAYKNLARSVHMTARDPDDKERRLLFLVKSNLGPEKRTALAYRVVEHTFARDDGVEIPTSRLDFEAGDVVADVAEAFGSERERAKRGPAPRKTTEAAEWLFDFLSEDRNPRPLGAIFDAAGPKGLVGSKKGDGKWSNVSLLYKARDRVPDLIPPRAGHRVEKLEVPIGRGGRDVVHWQLLPDEEPY
jgi:hypothetical protein